MGAATQNFVICGATFFVCIEHVFAYDMHLPKAFPKEALLGVFALGSGLQTFCRFCDEVCVV